MAIESAAWQCKSATTTTLRRPRSAAPSRVLHGDPLPRSIRADPPHSRLRLDVRATIPEGRVPSNVFTNCSWSSATTSPAFARGPDAGKMAAVLPSAHAYNSPVAGGNANQLNGDVRGQVHLGDNIYYGR